MSEAGTGSPFYDGTFISIFDNSSDPAMSMPLYDGNLFTRTTLQRGVYSNAHIDLFDNMSVSVVVLISVDGWIEDMVELDRAEHDTFTDSWWTDEGIRKINEAEQPSDMPE